jgi:hypothetical protein
MSRNLRLTALSTNTTSWQYTLNRAYPALLSSCLLHATVGQ